ncbi:MAG: efflux RND transporter periplasmic adaptor subunit, partial [Kiritimatiellia bacterium]
AEAQASVSRLEAGLELIRIQEASNREQLQLAERSRDLARKEFERARRLSEEGQAVSEAVVESSERSLTQAETQVLQLRQALALVPGQILETESGLKAARAGVEQARLQLARTAIRSPLSGRIVLAQVEQAEVLQPGQMIFEIAEDSRLEIEVPVTAADLRNWIPFAQNPSPALRGWFAPLLPVPVEIRWSESSSEALWEGELNRIVRFDATTRTAMLAVRIPEEKLITHATGLPLSEGMFCQVRIPGKELKQVFAVPRSAVTFDNKCYLYVDGRLKTVEVSVARSEGDITYISGGIQPGDQVIITRLVAPLEGVKLVEAE